MQLLWGTAEVMFFPAWVLLWDHLMQSVVISLSGCQFVEGRDSEPETQGH